MRGLAFKCIREYTLPTLVSSKKRLRQEHVRQGRNATVKSALRTAIKRLRGNTDAEAAPGLVSQAYSKLDKAVKRGVMHRRTAARIKSRLTKQAN